MISFRANSVLGFRLRQGSSAGPGALGRRGNTGSALTGLRQLKEEGTAAGLGGSGKDPPRQRSSPLPRAEAPAPGAASAVPPPPLSVPTAVTTALPAGWAMGSQRRLLPPPSRGLVGSARQRPPPPPVSARLPSFLPGAAPVLPSWPRSRPETCAGRRRRSC